MVVLFDGVTLHMEDWLRGVSGNLYVKGEMACDIKPFKDDNVGLLLKLLGVLSACRDMKES